MFRSGRLRKDLKGLGPMPVLWFDAGGLEALAEGRLVVAELSEGPLAPGTVKDPRAEHWFLALPDAGRALFGADELDFEGLEGLFREGVLFRARLTEDLARVQVKRTRPARELFEHLCAAADRLFQPAYSVKLTLESELPSMMELAVTLPFSREAVAVTHRAPGGTEHSFGWLRRKGPKLAVPLWFLCRDGQWVAYSENGLELPPKG